MGCKSDIMAFGLDIMGIEPTINGCEPNIMVLETTMMGCGPKICEFGSNITYV
jgi:hypothetical protein